MKGSGPLYLSHLLETIRDQKFTNFEVCISDHSKNDKILDLCGEYANHFTVKYFKNEENRGNCSSNINSVVEMCEGRITKLIFMDDMFMRQQNVIGVSTDLHTLVMVSLMKG
mgnify:CR=1 FL=1